MAPRMQSECVLRVDLPERLVDWGAPTAEKQAAAQLEAKLAQRLSDGVQLLGTTFRFLGCKTDQRKSDTKIYLLACPSQHEPTGLLS